MWDLKAFEGQWLRARLCCRKISDSIFWLHHFTGRRNALPKESPKRNIQKEKIETDKRRKHFFHTLLYLLGEETNWRYVPRRSVVPKTPGSKMVLLVRRTLPESCSLKGKEEILFFFLRMRHLLFRYRPLGVSSNLIVFFLSIYFFFLI